MNKRISDILNGTIERDPMDLFKSAKPTKIQTAAEAKAERDSRNAETDLQNLICKWINKEWPGTLFISDFAAGLKLSHFLAGIRSAQSCMDKYPDLTIIDPRGGYFGLIIEIKTVKGDVRLKNGSISKAGHADQQHNTLKKMMALGYMACFGIGEDHIKRIITKYKSLPLTKITIY